MHYRLALLCLIFGSAMLMSCAEIKQAGRDIGHATRDATKAIGHGTRDATRAIGHGTRDAVKEVGEGSKRVLNDTE